MSGIKPCAPAVMVLCGLPFSGKSTLGRALSDATGAVHVEIDKIVISQGSNFTSGTLSSTVWVAAYREGHRRLDELLATQGSVIWDAVSFRWSHREKLRRLASQHDARCKLIWLDIPLAEIGRRRNENRLSGARADVPDAEFAMVADGFQPPRADEGAVRYDPLTDSIPLLLDRLDVYTTST